MKKCIFPVMMLHMMNDQPLPPKIGLALGGGGAKGYAHIPMLQVFDEVGIRPHRISGTSIGSIMGAMYASGISGSGIRQVIKDHFFSKGEAIKELFNKKNIFKPLEFFDLEWKRGGILKGDKIIQFLYDQMGCSTFEDLDIPLSVVTTDYWTGDQVVLDSGDLLSAIKASMGLPGIFTPVEREGCVLIDGGGVNPVPHDLLAADCDVVIAIDVMGARTRGRHDVPGVLNALIGTFDIMQESIIRGKLQQHPPTHYLRPPLEGVDLLSFDRAEQIYPLCKETCDELRSILQGLKTDALP